MNKLFNILVLAVALVGCGKKVCADLQEQICKSCDVGEDTRNTVCACLEDGEVRNGREYFDSPDEAEAYCYYVKVGLEDKHVGPDAVAECTGDLEVFEEFDANACELHGYEAGSGDYGSTDYCEALAQEFCDCYGYDSEYCYVIQEEIDSYSESECEFYLEEGVC